MRRLKLGVGLFVFLGTLCAQATAQEIPEEARRAIAINLEGPFVLLRDAMRDELKLSDEQKEKLDEYFREQLPDIMQFFQSLDGVDHDEREPKLKAFRQKAREKLSPVLKATLKEDQMKRLRQVELQQEGAFVLHHGEPKIAKDLKITDAQRKQFVAVMQELQKKVQPLIKEAESGDNHEEIRSKIMKIKKEQEDKIEALLTDTQKKQWKELLGKPLALED
jgi:Spy/CpxP family protein refolding chaperone